MKKILLLITFLVSFSFMGVLADEDLCSYSDKRELSTAASHIKINYEVKTGKYSSSQVGCDGGDDCANEYEYFKVYILNMPSTLFVEITNNQDDTKQYLYSSNADENGVLSFEHKRIMNKTTYTLKFYGSINSKCYGEHIKSFTKALPRKNMNYYESICQEAPKDSDVCQKFVFFDEMEYSQFYRIVNDEVAQEKERIKKEEESKNWFDKAIDFISENKWWFIGGLVVIVGAGAVITVTRKKDM